MKIKLVIGWKKVNFPTGASNIGILYDKFFAQVQGKNERDFYNMMVWICAHCSVLPGIKKKSRDERKVKHEWKKFPFFRMWFARKWMIKPKNNFYRFFKTRFEWRANFIHCHTYTHNFPVDMICTVCSAVGKNSIISHRIRINSLSRFRPPFIISPCFFPPRFHCAM